jgi:tetrahydromethanopterin S-methyltransferase subunit E
LFYDNFGKSIFWRFFMPTIQNPANRLQITAKIGVFLSTFVMALLCLMIAYMMWQAIADPDHLSIIMSDQLDLLAPAPLLGTVQALLLTAFWITTDLIALSFLGQTRSLFIGIRRCGVFTTATALRLRRIGWLVIAIGPVSVVVNLCATMMLGYWRDPTTLTGSIEISDSDFYAVVVGLVIVAVGHIMVDAARLDAENRAFV